MKTGGRDDRSQEERAMNLFELIQIFLMVLVLVVLSYID